jgi:hypothetical protein
MNVIRVLPSGRIQVRENGVVVTKQLVLVGGFLRVA